MKQAKIIGGIVMAGAIVASVYVRIPKGRDQQAGVIAQIAGDASPSPSRMISPAPLSMLRFVPQAQKGLLPSQADVSHEVETKKDDSGFEQKALEVDAGEIVLLDFVNRSPSLWHSWVLVEPGREREVQAAARKEGPEYGYMPVMPDAIIAHTRVIGPDDTERIIFKAPSRPGSYPFVSTTPGDESTMNGLLVVR